MKKMRFESTFIIVAVWAMAGCAASHDTLYLSTLKSDVQAVSNLEREQQNMITSKASPGEVYGKVQHADPFLKEIRETCKNKEHGPLNFLSSCNFYRELSFKITSNMMLNAGKYYLKNGDKEKSERILRELTVTYTDEAFQAEANQAKMLLEKLKNWDALSHGMKAYLLGDYATAFQEFKTKEDPESLYYVGQLYYVGSGVPRDLKQAFEWFGKAAEKGYAPAQYQMGLLYLNGDGTGQDTAEAGIWIKKAADQDYKPAIDLLRTVKTK